MIILLIFHKITGSAYIIYRKQALMYANKCIKINLIVVKFPTKVY